MEQEGCAPANERRKINKAKTTPDPTVQNVAGTDGNTVDNLICTPTIDLTNKAWVQVFNYISIADRVRITRVCRQWRHLARMSWKSLTRLSFENMFKSLYEGGSSNRLTDDILKVCLQECGTQLRHLDLSSIYGNLLTSRALDLVSLYCTSLQELKLDCTYILDKTALEILAKPLSTLRYLNLQGSHSGIGEGELMCALKRLQTLKVLIVANNANFTGEFFSQAPQSLTDVCLRCCSSLTDKGVHLLAERCQNLEIIDITACCRITGQSLRIIADNCPRVKKFTFGRMGSQRLQTSDILLTLSKLPLLEELNMDWNSAAVTDEVFYELGRHCPLIRSISCAGCHNLTDDALYHLSPCLHLEKIDLSLCRLITDRGLGHLRRHRELERVCLASCNHISEEGVAEFRQGHPNITLDLIHKL